MKTGDHKILDHPIIGYFLPGAFAMILSELAGMIDGVIDHHYRSCRRSCMGIVADPAETPSRDHRTLE